MSYILLWVVFNPIYLGEYASLEACKNAKGSVAAMAREGNSVVAAAVKAPPISLQDYDKIMACVPKG